MDWKSRRIRALLEAALAEDRAGDDVTTALTVDLRSRATGTIVAKQPCVVAGLGSIAAFFEVFAKMHASPARFEVISHPEIFDGVTVRRGATLAVIRHNAGALLSCERSILNLLGRMSGIATMTHAFVNAVRGTGTKVLDTRKTIPGLRSLDRYAVCCGGGLNHRQDLQDGILIKNNHIALAGSLRQALERALERRLPGQVVQVEVRTQEELDEAIEGGAESILLDNMSPAAVRRAVKRIHEALPGVSIEAAGSMTLETVRDYAEAGVDYVTVGALTHSVSAADLSMRVVPGAV